MEMHVKCMYVCDGGACQTCGAACISGACTYVMLVHVTHMNCVVACEICNVRMYVMMVWCSMHVKCMYGCDGGA